MLGAKIANLLDQEMETGRWNVEWNGTDDSDKAVPTGIYFVEIKTVSGKQTLKMIKVE